MRLRTQNLTKTLEMMCRRPCELNFERGVYGLLALMEPEDHAYAHDGGRFATSSGKVTLDGVTIGELGAKYETSRLHAQEVGYYRDFTAKRFLQYLGHSKGWTQSTQTAE